MQDEQQQDELIPVHDKPPTSDESAESKKTKTKTKRKYTKRPTLPGVVQEHPVRCPGCHEIDNVIRNTEKHNTHILRRRKCLKCNRLFSSRLSLDKKSEKVEKY